MSQWGIHDFIIWNEPNTSLYWSPQDSTAPAAYEALLARCYDAIHAADSSARVIGFGLSPRSNGSGQTAPIPFILAVGAAYKASGRTTPIMDQMSIHPYPNPSSPADGPDVGYSNPDFYGVPNLDRVKQAIYDAFHGTGQPTTLNGLTFRIDELGWQTNTTAYPQYYNQENVAVVSEQTQASYVQEAIQKYLACDPTVTDVEWFLLVDEATRNGKDQERHDHRRRLAERAPDRRRSGRVDREGRLHRGRAVLRAGSRSLYGRDVQLDTVGGIDVGLRRQDRRFDGREIWQAGQAQGEAEAAEEAPQAEAAQVLSLDP